MKLFINASTCLKGGAVQQAFSFLSELARDPWPHELLIALSAPVKEAIAQASVEFPSAKLVLAESPAKNLAARRALAELEKKFSPECVFTLSGAAYVPFQSPHLMACQQPWLSGDTRLAYKGLRSGEYFRTKLRNLYRRPWFRKADAWLTQTEAARQGMHRRLKIPLERIAVVPNTCAPHYRAHSETAQRPHPTPGQTVRLLYLAAPYPHKCFDMLPRVAAELKRLRPTLATEFITTLPPAHRLTRRMLELAAKLGVSDRIANRGPISPVNGPILYRECDIAFVPSVLEVFTANYPEAMAMGLPVVTSDLDFARSVCHDAASYFRPLDATSAAAQILSLLDNPQSWQQQIANGKQVLARLPNTRQQFEATMLLLRQLVAGEPLSSWESPPQA